MDLGDLEGSVRNSPSGDSVCISVSVLVLVNTLTVVTIRELIITCMSLSPWIQKAIHVIRPGQALQMILYVHLISVFD